MSPRVYRADMPGSTSTCLVADIGGTHARFALFDIGSHALSHVETLAAARYPQLEDAVTAYLAAAGGVGVAEAAFAVAAPIAGESYAFTNSPWRFRRDALRERLRLARLEVLNDFEALALSLPLLGPAQRHALRAGRGEPAAPCVVLGPGTGLGVATLLPAQRCPLPRARALPGEGGHVGFAPQGALESELLAFLSARHGRVSYERLLCGDGLVAIDEFLAVRDDAGAVPRTAAAVTAAALAGTDARAARAVGLFCAVLGSFAGDVALLLGARGGVYLGGGILPRILPLLERSDFLARFLAKGRVAAVLDDVPVHVVLDPFAALHGAGSVLA